MECSPIMEMKVSQDELKAMFERNKHLAQLNPGYHMGYAETKSLPAGNLVSQWQTLPHNVAKTVGNKYRNIKVEHDGLKFDSKKELQCWLSLQLRQKLGEISKLERQVIFPLVVNSRSVGRFTADFTWVENGQVVVADTKSPPTRKETAYRLRKKIFEALFYPLVIREL